MSFSPITDKVASHTYHTMYGQFLIPYYAKFPNMKMLEIGLGCDMKYGPGASVQVWKALFPLAELWEAEVDRACVKAKKEDGSLTGFHVLVGNQGDSLALDKQIELSGSDFDIIIDDGGHSNCMISITFEKLQPAVKSGGLCFIEDMHKGKDLGTRYTSSKGSCDGKVPVPDRLEEMIDKLIYEKGRSIPDVEFIYCQSQACVIGKSQNARIKNVVQAL